MRAFVLFILLLSWIAPATAEEALTEADRTAIREIVERQLEALQRDDGAAAFALNSPTVRAQFGTADRFMEAMRTEYAALHRPRATTYQDISLVHGLPVQKLLVVGPDGRAATAHLPMQKQVNGVWRIHGHVLVPLEGEGI